MTGQGWREAATSWKRRTLRNRGGRQEMRTAKGIMIRSDILGRIRCHFYGCRRAGTHYTVENQHVVGVYCLPHSTTIGLPTVRRDELDRVATIFSEDVRPPTNVKVGTFTWRSD